MSNLSKTISYLKRNGIKNTCNEVLERLDKNHLEEMQKKVNVYQGDPYYWDEKVLLMYAAGHDLKNTASGEIPKKPAFQKDYLFSILVPAYETNEKYLKEMIESVLVQKDYARVELIIADASRTSQVKDVVNEYTNFPQIKYVRLKENRGISENTNEALKVAKGDYIGLLDHDDTLSYDALFHVRQKLEEKDYAFLYSDEDKGDGELTRFFEPNMKPDFNLDYLFSNNYICHFLVMKAELMKKLKFRKEYDGAQDFDLVLRAAGEVLKEKGGKDKIAHIPKVLYHWRCHESSTSSNPESKRYAYEAGKRAVSDFLKTYMGLNEEKAVVDHTMHLGFYRITYKQGIFKARPEVAAICGRVIKKNLVTDGPKWITEEGQINLFTGLKASYGGYMHRTKLILEVDAMPESAVCWNEKYQALFKTMEKQGKKLTFEEKQQIAREQGDIFLYVPNFQEIINDSQ